MVAPTAVSSVPFFRCSEWCASGLDSSAGRSAADVWLALVPRTCKTEEIRYQEQHLHERVANVMVPVTSSLPIYISRRCCSPRVCLHTSMLAISEVGTYRELNRAHETRRHSVTPVYPIGHVQGETFEGGRRWLLDHNHTHLDSGLSDRRGSPASDISSHPAREEPCPFDVHAANRLAVSAYFKLFLFTTTG
jgi:hypothetical protein